MKLSLYDLLGVSRDATPAQIKKAYRDKSKQLHPDLNGGDGEEFRRLAEAYAILSNPASRERYDLTGAATTEDDWNALVLSNLIPILYDAFKQTVNPLRTTRSAIREGVDAAKSTVTKQNASLDKVLKKLTKFSSKKGSALLLLALTDRVQEERRKVEELQTQIHLGESMLKLLDDYEFAEDEQVSIVFSKNSDHYSAFRSMFDQF